MNYKYYEINILPCPCKNFSTHQKIKVAGAPKIDQRKNFCAYADVSSSWPK